MKILFLLESTRCDDAFLYTKALVEALSADGYEPKIAFTTGGTPSDHTYQLVKAFVVHHLTKLCFRSGDPDYTERLANHVSSNGYDFLVVSQSAFGSPPVKVTSAYELMEHKPQLVFLAQQCSGAVSQAAEALAPLSPRWVSVSQNTATRFLSDYDVQVIYGPAVEAECLGVDIKTEYRIPTAAKVLGYIGNLDDCFVEIMLEVSRRLQAFLLIAGTGGRVSSLAEMSGPMRVIPAIPNYRGDWYKAMNCFLYPVRSGGFPMFPVEAAMAGVPVAMTPVSDFYQLMGDRMGFGGPNADQMVKAVISTGRIDTASCKSYLQDRFSPERFLSDWQMLLS